MLAVFRRHLNSWVARAFFMLLVGTFVIGGVHTLLWLPRAIEMRRELKLAEAREEAALLAEAEAESPAPPSEKV